jgi:hypothetical protein
MSTSFSIEWQRVLLRKRLLALMTYGRPMFTEIYLSSILGDSIFAKLEQGMTVDEIVDEEVWAYHESLDIASSY